MEYRQIGYACIDCAMAIANDDYRGMDEETTARVRRGIAKAPGYLVLGDEVGFVHDGCDVCKDHCAGDKHEVGCLVNGERQ